MQEKIYIWAELWFIWLVLTLIYVVPQVLSGGDSENSVTYLIGLFVPYGVWNTGGFFSGLGILFSSGLGFFSSFNSIFNFYFYLGFLRILLPIILIILLKYNNKMMSFLRDEPIIKLILNLLILLTFTALVDFVTWGGWCSLSLAFPDFQISNCNIGGL